MTVNQGHQAILNDCINQRYIENRTKPDIFVEDFDPTSQT